MILRPLGDEEDDDDTDLLGHFFDHVFVPMLVAASTLLALAVASASLFAVLWLWSQIYGIATHL